MPARTSKIILEVKCVGVLETFRHSLTSMAMQNLQSLKYKYSRSLHKQPVADLGGGAKGARAPPFKVADFFVRDEPPMRANMSTSRRLTLLHALICTVHASIVHVHDSPSLWLRRCSRCGDMTDPVREIYTQVVACGTNYVTCARSNCH